ncbi:MAG: ATP-binding protein [Atribacterota bacterium]
MKDLADHLFDILENSVNAGANEVIVKITHTSSYFFCSISDNGKGISGQEVLDPFVTSRKTRRVGLGLPLLKRAVEDTGGYLKITRIDESGGTALQFKMYLTHIDAKPLGDLARTFSDIFFAWPEVALKLFVIEDDMEKLILDFQELRNEIERGQKDYVNIRKHIVEVSRKELKI